MHQNYLHAFRGMVVNPEQIIVGAGTEYLYSLLIQLLGDDKIYGIENPGYPKIAKILSLIHIFCCEPFKTTAKFQWFWIFYTMISFFSYTQTAIQITTNVYVKRYWISIFILKLLNIIKMVICLRP